MLVIKCCDDGHYCQWNVIFRNPSSAPISMMREFLIPSFNTFSLPWCRTLSLSVFFCGFLCLPLPVFKKKILTPTLVCTRLCLIYLFIFLISLSHSHLHPRMLTTTSPPLTSSGTEARCEASRCKWDSFYRVHQWSQKLSRLKNSITGNWLACLDIVSNAWHPPTPRPLSRWVISCLVFFWYYCTLYFILYVFTNNYCSFQFCACSLFSERIKTCSTWKFISTNIGSSE